MMYQVGKVPGIFASDVFYKSLEGNWWENTQEKGSDFAEVVLDSALNSNDGKSAICFNKSLTKLFWSCTETS